MQCTLKPLIKYQCVRSFSSSSSNSGGETFEARFQHRFKTPQFLPPPEPFTNCAKTYPSRSSSNLQQSE